MAAAKSPAKPLTKNQLKQRLADDTGLSTKQVGTVLDALKDVLMKELNRKGVAAFTIPNIIKFRVAIKKATPEKQGINPLTKQPMTIKAKPKRNVVRMRALKEIKDCVL